MSKIKLASGTAFKIEDYATPNTFTILLDSLTADEVLENLTEENLSEIQFVTDSGTVIGIYHNKLMCDYKDDGDALAVRINDADLCRYCLVLGEDNRIIAVAPQRYASEDTVIVEKLTDGDITEYRYVDGEYIYDPLPKDEAENKPTQEERITALEAQLAAYEAAYAQGVNEA